MKNFGLIKTIFNNIMVDGIVEKNDSKKKLYVEFVKKVKKNKILRSQFEVFNILEETNGLDESMRNEFIKESINLLSEFDRDKIVLENVALMLPLVESDYNISEFDYKEKDLHESITELIFTKKSAKTLNKILEHTKKISLHIETPTVIVETKSAGVPNSMLTSIMVNRFNEKYSDLNENEMKIINSIITGNVESQKETQKNIVDECINVVNDKLTTADVSLKETLLNVKDKLLKIDFLEETYISETIKLVELLKDLKED